MLTLLSSRRFDDVDEEADYSYHGSNHEVKGDRAVYLVRTYDDEPGLVAVVSPANARVLGEARDLVAFIVQQFGAKEIRFYRGAADGAPYAAVDFETLEFK